MIDKLIVKDIHLTAANDDQYFVFEDVLFQVCLEGYLKYNKRLICYVCRLCYVFLEIVKYYNL